MGNPAGVRRDFAALEARRMEAARLLRQGLSQSQVARAVGVHRQSVSRWAQELEQSGVCGLRQAKRTGRPPKLSPAQLRDLERAEQAIRQWQRVTWPRIKKKPSASGARSSSSTKAE